MRCIRCVTDLVTMPLSAAELNLLLELKQMIGCQGERLSTVVTKVEQLERAVAVLSALSTTSSTSSSSGQKGSVTHERSAKAKEFQCPLHCESKGFSKVRHLSDHLLRACQLSGRKISKATQESQCLFDPDHDASHAALWRSVFFNNASAAFDGINVSSLL